MNRFLILAVAGAAAIMSASCASASEPKDTGERISQRGHDINDYGKAWTDAHKDVTRGQKRIKDATGNLADAEKALTKARGHVAKAEQQISDAEAGQVSGQRLVQDGTERMQRSEAAYLAVRAGPSAVNPN
jgi:peptidoglycan hydrolase CwlO-like protein